MALLRLWLCLLVATLTDGQLGTEDAILDNSLAQRIDGSVGNFCVTLQTVDDQFIEQREENLIIVEFIAESGNSYKFMQCCVGGGPECQTGRLELTEGGADSEGVLCAVFAATGSGIDDDADQPIFDASVEPQGSGDVTIVSAQVDMDMGRSVFHHCVGLEAVNDGFIERTEEIDIIFDTSFNGVFGTCSVQILDNDDASVSCGSGLLIVFEEEGTAQFCGSITRSGEVISVAVEASAVSLNGQHASEGIVERQEDNFCVNVTISDEIAERTETLRTEVALISESDNGNLRRVDETNCELILIIDDDGPYLECTPVDRILSGGSTGENIQQFCINDAPAFRVVDMCMDTTVGSNDCSHWTPDTYSEVTELASATQLQILQSYIPFSTNDGCLKSVSMFLRTLYELDVMSVERDSCIVNCVLTIEANSCQRAYLLLENIPVTLLGNTSSITTLIQIMCNSTASVNIEVDFQCCPPPTDCIINEVTSAPSLPVTSRQPFSPSAPVAPTLAVTPSPLTSQPPFPPRPPPRVVSDSVPQAAIIGAAVGGTVVVVLTIIVVLLSVVICKKRRNTASIMKDDAVAAPPKRVIDGAFNNPAYTKEGVVYINELVYEEIADGRRGQINQSHNAKIDKWREVFAGKILEQSQVEYQKPIGEGAFGKIYKGRIITSPPGIPSVAYTEVAIKTLKKVSDQEVEDFIAESAIMLDFHHPNILSLVGVIFDTTDHLPVIVLPFMAHGDLRSYLKSKRTLSSSASASFDTLPTGLTEKMLVEMCLDIAKGMQYLSNRKFIHRDLAARNCMVDEALGVKVADFGMSRDVYHSDYYRLTHKARLPVKWMPPESFFDNIFNEKTDVWSFGVTCWEVFSLGCKPFPGIDNVDIPEFISSGHRLKKPTLCSSGMYDLMIETWSDNPEDRPTFQKLVASLASLCQSTGGLNHHYHILNAPTITVGERDGAPDAQYHVFEGPTAIPPVSGSAVNVHHYAVLEGQTSNPETFVSTYSEINDVDTSIPTEYEIPLSVLNTDSTHAPTS